LAGALAADIDAALGISQAAAWLQRVPLPQSCSSAVFMQLPRLEQMRPAAHRISPHIGPEARGSPAQPPSGVHCSSLGQMPPVRHSV
jgi:hypothetical protein